MLSSFARDMPTDQRIRFALWARLIPYFFLSHTLSLSKLITSNMHPESTVCNLSRGAPKTVHTSVICTQAVLSGKYKYAWNKLL